MITILIADDCANIRRFLKHDLEEEGYRVLVARDGEEAVAMVRSQHPDLAILDICMPRANGFEATERIAEIDPNIGIILFTNNDELCLQDRRSNLAAACVEKGDDLTELKLAIVSVLLRRTADSLFRPGLPPLREQPTGIPRPRRPEPGSPRPRS